MANPNEIRNSGFGVLELIVGDHPTYEDGDVKSATNYRRIRHMHADGICHVKNVPFNPDGLNPIGSLPDTFLSNTSQYKWERLGSMVRRTNLWTSDEVEYGSTPIEDPDRPGHMIHCHVSDHFNFLKKHPRHCVFGEAGVEFHYGGRQLADHPILDTIWTAIETNSSEIENDWMARPIGDRRKYLILYVDDFDNAEMGELSSPLMDNADPENPVIVKKRKNWATWRGMIDVIESDVLNKKKRVDIAEIRKRTKSQFMNVKSI